MTTTAQSCSTRECPPNRSWGRNLWPHQAEVALSPARHSRAIRSQIAEKVVGRGGDRSEDRRVESSGEVG